MAKKKKLAFDPQTFLATLSAGRSIVNYSKGQAIFAQGDPADAVFYVRKGKVKLTVTSTQGKEAVVALVDAGDFLGEGCLNGQP